MSKFDLGQLRKQLGLSQKSVGSLLGLQQTRISAIERGKYNPKTLTYRRYRELLVGESQRREPLKSFIAAVDALPMTRQQVSSAIGKPDSHVSNICNCRAPLTPDVEQAVQRLSQGEPTAFAADTGPASPVIRLPDVTVAMLTHDTAPTLLDTISDNRVKSVAMAQKKGDTLIIPAPPPEPVVTDLRPYPGGCEDSMDPPPQTAPSEPVATNPPAPAPLSDSASLSLVVALKDLQTAAQAFRQAEEQYEFAKLVAMETAAACRPEVKGLLNGATDPAYADLEARLTQADFAAAFSTLTQQVLLAEKLAELGV
jgi:DNA-binding XRE family transcriptional regulator